MKLKTSFCPPQGGAWRFSITTTTAGWIYSWSTVEGWASCPKILDLAITFSETFWMEPLRMSPKKLGGCETVGGEAFAWGAMRMRAISTCWLRITAGMAFDT